MRDAKTNSSPRPLKPSRRWVPPCHPSKPYPLPVLSAIQLAPSKRYANTYIGTQHGVTRTRSFSLSQAFKRSTQLGKALRASCFIHADSGPGSPRVAFDPQRLKPKHGKGRWPRLQPGHIKWPGCTFDRHHLCRRDTRPSDRDRSHSNPFLGRFSSRIASPDKVIPGSLVTCRLPCRARALSFLL